MLDAKSLFKMGLLPTHPELQNAFNRKRTKPGDWKNLEGFLILLPPAYTGFNLCTQTTKNLYVSQIKPVEWIRNPFKDLDMEPDLKELLASMLANTTVPTWKQSPRADRFGVRVLLHGSPGTGKNYIIDRVAEAAQRPLCRFNLADISTYPDEFNQSLERLSGFQRSWGCVIQLTAADLFEQRIAYSEVKRTLISSLFTFLEKSNGILFVTNDCDMFQDSGFHPLLDLKLSAEDIKVAHRRKVWADELMVAGIDSTVIPSSTPLNNSKLPDSDSEGRHNLNILNLAKVRLTDRQIRKAVQHTQQVSFSRGRQKPDLDLLIEILSMTPRQYDESGN
jgi:hypothetical protein